MNKQQILRSVTAAILAISNTVCLADNCTVSNFSTGFLWQQILVPSNIGATVLQKVSNLQATIADILTQTLILDSKLDNLNQTTTESILEESATILATSITINSLLDLLQTNANLIVNNLSVLEVVTNILNVDSQINLIKIETLNSTTDVLAQNTGINLSLAQDIDATLNITNSLFEPLITCTGLTSINSTTTITTPGDYCVAQTFSGSITIASSNVALNLNGNRIINPFATAITINPNLQQISITNGTLGAAVTGLQISSGVSDLELTNLQILDCTSSGINGSGTNSNPISKLRLNNSTIRNASGGIGLQLASAINSQFNLCDFALCATGVQLTSCFNMSMDTCDASRNNIAGFSLVNSGTNYFKNCTADENGIASTASSYGFISTNGTANIFDSCIADGTTTTTTDFNAVVAGFALTGSEMCSKIVDCEGCNSYASFTTTVTNGATIITGPASYGLLLQSTLLLTGSVPMLSTISQSYPQAMSWSPNSEYVAVANGPDNSITLINVSNPTSPVIASVLNTTIGQNGQINWSPDGQYLIFSSPTNSSFSIVNATNPTAMSIVSTTTIPTGCQATSWSPNGHYVAVSNNNVSNTGTIISIFNVDNPTSPLLVSTATVGTGPDAISWSPDSQYITVANYTSNNISIINVANPASPSLVYTYALSVSSGPAYSSWSPNNQYIAIGTFSTLQILNVTNPASPQLLTILNKETRALSWSPDSNYIAIVGQNGNYLNVLNVSNPTSPLLDFNITSNINAPQSVIWSPNGQYIAVGNTGNSTVNLFAFNPPSTPTSINSGIYSPDGYGIQTAAWSPDNKYLAVANYDSKNSVIALYVLNQSNPSLLTLASTVSTLPDMQTIAWSPDGKFLAGVTYDSPPSSNSILVVYSFNPNTSNVLTLVQTINTGLNGCIAFSWSPNGQYLATSINSGNNAPLQIYRYNPTQTNPLSLAFQTNTSTGGPYLGLSWSPNSQNIALISKDNPAILQIYSVQNGTLSLVANLTGLQVNNLAVGNDIKWAPNGSYLAVTNNSVIQIYSFNNTTQIPTLVGQITAPVAGNGILTWSPDGSYLAALNGGTPMTLQIYAFNPEINNFLNQLAVINTQIGHFEPPLTWSPDGSYIALASAYTSYPIIQLYNALQFPTNNIIQNNTTYCNLIATGTSQIAGVGISGSNIANLIIENTSYNNQFNYQFVTTPGIYNPLFNYLPSPLQNISQAGGQAVSYPQNIVPFTDQIQAQVSQLQTQIDTIYNNMCTAESLTDILVTSPVQSLLDNAQTQMATAVSVIDLFFPCCSSTPITGPTTISTSGVYCLSKNISGPIVINADAVSLDLNGYVLTTNGVTINPGIKLATIKNGTISNTASSGIIVSAGSSATKITNVNVEFAANNGILLQNTESCVIKNCDLSLNATGLEIESSNKVVVSNCSAIGNGFAGFNLVTSSTNVFLDCKAIGNGANSAGNSYGFASQSGTGNIFERCIASGTNLSVSAQSNPGNVAAGFALIGTENCSKIIDSKSCDNTTEAFTTGPGNYNTPYGILLQEQFTGITTFTNVQDIPTPVSISWSPDNKLLATVDNNGGAFTAGTLRIFNFVPFAATLTQVATFTISTGFTAVAFSPNGQFLATAEKNAGNTTTAIRIFSVNEYSATYINQVGITSISGVGINTIAWSPNNNYLVAGDSGGNFRTFVLNYLQSTGNALTQIGNINQPGVVANSIAWHPSGSYVTVSGNATNNIIHYLFNPAAASGAVLSSIQTISVGGTVNSITWSPCGNYLAIATNAAIVIYLINVPTTGQLTQLGTSFAGATTALSWAPNCAYLAAINNTPAIAIYNFNPLNNTPISSLGSLSIASAATLSWSPDGQYVATNGTNTTQVLSVLSFPQKNIVKNNTIACNIGSGFSPSVPGTTVSLGFGISGSSVGNLIINNLAYNNTNNYAFITNIFSELLYGNSVPSPLQNISLISQQPLVKPENANLLVDNIQTLAYAMQSKVDFLFRAAFP